MIAEEKNELNIKLEVLVNSHLTNIEKQEKSKFKWHAVFGVIGVVILPAIFLLLSAYNRVTANAFYLVWVSDFIAIIVAIALDFKIIDANQHYFIRDAVYFNSFFLALFMIFIAKTFPSVILTFKSKITEVLISVTMVLIPLLVGFSHTRYLNIDKLDSSKEKKFSWFACNSILQVGMYWMVAVILFFLVSVTKEQVETKNTLAITDVVCVLGIYIILLFYFISESNIEKEVQDSQKVILRNNKESMKEEINLKVIIDGQNIEIKNQEIIDE